MSTLAQKKKVKSRLKDLKSRIKGGGKFFIIKDEGTIRMRPLPVGESEPGIEAVYFYLGKDIKGVISPASFGEPCAIMDSYNELKDSKDPDDKDLAATFRPKKRFFVPHIKYLDDKGLKVDDDSGAKLLILTNDLYQELLELWLDDDEAGDFTDPKKGYDLKYTRSGKGQFDTSYSVRACKPTKLDKKYNKEYNPEKMLKEIMPTYEETKDLLDKFLNVPNTDNDLDKPSKETKKKKKSKK